MIEVGLLALKSTVVIAGAFLVAVMARRGRASMRHGVFAALFVTLLLLPLVPQFVKTTTVSVPAALVQTMPVATTAPAPAAGVAKTAAPAELQRSTFALATAVAYVYLG